VHAGWLLKNKGIWSVTDAGKKAMNDFPDPEEFYREADRLYRSWKQSLSGETEKIEDAKDDVADTAAAKASVTYEEAEEQAWNEIEKYLHAMPPYELQNLVADLLWALGYHVDWVSPPGKDGGIDIIAYKDALGIQVPRIKVQVKRVDQKIDTPTLKSFLANIHADDVGLYISTGGFTKDAEQEARSQSSNRKITLINLERLVELWIENLGRLKDKSRLPLRPIYFLSPET
jgi:restriction system protein